MAKTPAPTPKSNSFPTKHSNQNKSGLGHNLNHPTKVKGA